MEYKIENITCKNGLPTLKLNGYFLHSKYNPVQEATLFVENNYEKDNIHILFGYGCGYIVDAMLERMAPAEKLVIIDPLIENNLVDVKEAHQENEQLFFLKAEFIPQLYTFTRGLETIKYQLSYKVYYSPNYEKVFPELLKELFKQVKEVQYRNISDVATIFRFKSIWQKNVIYNLCNMKKDQSLKVLENYSNKPVVIASGGPSLTKQLPLLKKYRDEVILIAAGSTINSLLRENLSPDYLVVIDGDEENNMHFKHIEKNNISIIYTPTSYYEIRDCFGGNGYLFLLNSDQQLKTILKEQFDEDYVFMNGGGTVAHYSLSVANYISTGPIALIGQDLAFTDLKTHADGNKHFKVMEKLDTKNLIATEGYNGDEVFTSTVLYNMKKDFDVLVKTYKNPNRMFNCTEGGAKLHNFNQIPFEQFLSNYTAGVVEEQPAIAAENVPVQKIYDYYVTFLNESTAIKEALAKKLKTINKKGKFSDKQVKDVTALNLRVAEFSKKYPIDVSFQKLDFEASRMLTTFKKDGKEVNLVEYTIKFYTDLTDILNSIIDYLNVTIELLEMEIK